MHYALTDAEWRLIDPILPCKPRGIPRVDDRRVLNGIFWVLRSGPPWRDLPERYGPCTTCCSLFVRWRTASIWDCILTTISHRDDADVQIVDNTIFRAHQHTTCVRGRHHDASGCSRGGLTTKIHAVVDANGLPITLALVRVHQHGSLSVANLLNDVPKGGMLSADKAYDADTI